MRGWILWGFVLLLLGDAQALGAEWRWGTHLGVSFPELLQLGVRTRCQQECLPMLQDLEFHLSGGGMLYPWVRSDRSFEVLGVQAGTRWFPGQSSFFLLMDLGYRHVGVAADLSFLQIEGETVASSTSVSFSTLYVKPGFGVSFSLGQSWRFEMELGVQLPWLSSGRMSFLNQATGENSSNSARLQTNSDVAMSRIAGLILPQVTLARFVHHF